MGNTLATLSPQEFESLVAQAIDKRMSVWLTQLLDALGNEKAENMAEFQPEFAASLKQSIAQATAGDTLDLNTFRQHLANG